MSIHQSYIYYNFVIIFSGNKKPPVKAAYVFFESFAFSASSLLYSLSPYEPTTDNIQNITPNKYFIEKGENIVERIKEIGVIRSLGGRKKDVSHLFNAETFIIGLTAGLLGIGVTLLLNIPINIVMIYISI